MDFADLQDRTAHLASRAWPYDATGIDLGDSLIARLAEETGELARAVRRYGGERWGHPGGGGGDRGRGAGRAGRRAVPGGPDRQPLRGEPGGFGSGSSSQDREEDRRC